MPKKTAKPVRTRTESEYLTTEKYLGKWKESNNITFANFLLQQKMAQATRYKHFKQALTLQKRGYNIGNKIIGTLSPPTEQPPLSFSDIDFEKLYDGFLNIDFPRFIQSGERHRYWQCIMHFAAVTALRREAILGLEMSNIDFDNLVAIVPPGIDKKNKLRRKPLTKELVDEILGLRRFYDSSMMVPGQRKRLFPWIHGNKAWYACWHIAEANVGKRFHLHDLKRFAGILALRAGATPLELQQHMDHASLETTLKHYCQPPTTDLVQRRIKVPIPRKSLHTRQTPLFTEPELEAIIREAVVTKLRSLGIQNLPDIILDRFGNPFIDHRTSEEQLAKAKEQGLRIYREGGAS